MHEPQTIDGPKERGGGREDVVGRTAGRSGAEAVELLFKDPEGYKLARDEYNKKMKEEILEEGAPDRAFLLQAAAVGLGSFLFGLYGPKRN